MPTFVWGEATNARGEKKTARIRTANGRVLYDHNVEAPRHTRVIGTPALQYMNQMMRQVLVSGTGTRARVPGYDLAGKTGTTSDYRDAWFVGYTGGFVTAVWTGRDDNTSMKRVTGGGVPAAMWRAFMAQALPRLQVSAIPGGAAPPPPAQPAGDAISDLLAAAGIGGGRTDGEGGPAPQPQQAPPPSAAPPPRDPSDLY